MNKKDLETRTQITLLVDTYGELLTEKQLNILEMYFFEDLSLSEISKINNSSRQSILDAINKSINQLSNFEEKLHILEKEKEFKEKKQQLLYKLDGILDISLQEELCVMVENL